MSIQDYFTINYQRLISVLLCYRTGSEREIFVTSSNNNWNFIIFDSINMYFRNMETISAT